MIGAAFTLSALRRRFRRLAVIGSTVAAATVLLASLATVLLP